jgi:hypothetical protein
LTGEGILVHLISDCSGQQIAIPLFGRGKVRERLAVKKQTTQRFHIVWFNLKKLNEVEDKDRSVTKSNIRLAALENRDAEVQNIDTSIIQKDTETSTDASEEVGLKVNVYYIIYYMYNILLKVHWNIGKFMI